MKYLKIEWATLQVFRECEVQSFPINCFHINQHYGFKLVQYSTLPENKRHTYMELSEYVCVIEHTLFYNDSMNEHRIRLSIVHELIHYILHTANEADANQFAGYLLAPRMAIHYADCKNYADVSQLFNISEEAEDYAFQDYRRWHRIAVYRINIMDKAMYEYFYNKQIQQFAYSITYCYDCDELLYNQPGIHQCHRCKHRHLLYRGDRFVDEAGGI